MNEKELKLEIERLKKLKDSNKNMKKLELEYKQLLEQNKEKTNTEIVVKKSISFLGKLGKGITKIIMTPPKTKVTTKGSNRSRKNKIIDSKNDEKK